MARQVAHEIKNPLTPIQLAAEHLQRVHEDQGRPLGPVFDQCVTTVLEQVRLLRQIASEFANFAGEPTPRLETASPAPTARRRSSTPVPPRPRAAGHVRDASSPPALPADPGRSHARCRARSRISSRTPFRRCRAAAR